VGERAERKKRRRREEEESWEEPFYTPKNTYLPKVPSSLAPSLIVNVILAGVEAEFSNVV
jgi:hypothetical protein